MAISSVRESPPAGPAYSPTGGRGGKLHRPEFWRKRISAVKRGLGGDQLVRSCDSRDVSGHGQ